MEGLVPEEAPGQERGPCWVGDRRHLAPSLPPRASPSSHPPPTQTSGKQRENNKGSEEEVTQCQEVTTHRETETKSDRGLNPAPQPARQSTRWKPRSPCWSQPPLLAQNYRPIKNVRGGEVTTAIRLLLRARGSAHLNPLGNGPLRPVPRWVSHLYE